MHEIGQNEEDEVFNVPSLVPSNLCNCYGSPVDLFQGVSSYFSQNSDEFYINPFLPIITDVIPFFDITKGFKNSWLHTFHPFSNENCQNIALAVFLFLQRFVYVYSQLFVYIW